MVSKVIVHDSIITNVIVESRFLLSLLVLSEQSVLDTPSAKAALSCKETLRH